MIRIKLEKNKKDEPIFKLYIKDEELDNYRFLKRALLESKKIKGRYNYQVPLRFFEPIFRNISSEEIKIDRYSLDYYLEFSDQYDEKYYYKIDANALFMKKWRLEGCPNIYKVILNKEDGTLTKEIAFERINSMLDT